MLFRSLPALTQPTSIRALTEFILPKRTLFKSRERSEREQKAQLRLVKLLGESGDVEAIVPLARALFHPNGDIAYLAKQSLLAGQQDIVPPLLAELPMSVSARHWTEEGIIRVMKTLEERGDKRASARLLKVAQKYAGVRFSYIKVPLSIASFLITFQTEIGRAHV